MKSTGNNSVLLAAVLALLAFSLLTKPSKTPSPLLDRIVISAPLQLLMTGGDPFLAANFENIRVSSTWDGVPGSNYIDSQFRLRAHDTISQLNACHEDNYYQANAVIAWSGAPTEGNLILKRSMDCRKWDDIPAFFYGFNNHYFLNNNKEAIRALKIASLRAPQKTSYKRLVISIQADLQPNDHAALNFLRNEYNRTTDLKLKNMLKRSILRLEGLVLLRDAQKLYEKRFNMPLTDPSDLIKSNIISNFPNDPLGIGFVFDNRKFEFRKLNIN